MHIGYPLGRIPRIDFYLADHLTTEEVRGFGPRLCPRSFDALLLLNRSAFVLALVVDVVKARCPRDQVVVDAAVRQAHVGRVTRPVQWFMPGVKSLSSSSSFSGESTGGNAEEAAAATATAVPVSITVVPARVVSTTAAVTSRSVAPVSPPKAAAPYAAQTDVLA